MSRRRLVNLLLSVLLLTPLIVPICLQSGITRAAEGKEKGKQQQKKKKRQVQPKRKGVVRKGSQRRRRRAAGRRGDRDRDKKKEEDRYHVVRVNDTAQVVKGSKLASFRTGILKKYRRDLAAYKEARAKAEGEGRSFDKPKPTLRYKVLTSTGYKTEKAAQAFRSKVLQALKRNGKPAEKGTEKRKKNQKKRKKG
jgi:hypothetical protein